MRAKISSDSAAIKTKRGTDSEVWKSSRLSKTVDREPMKIEALG
jgi:hypothetical protein